MKHTRSKIGIAILFALLLIRATVPPVLQTEIDKLNKDESLKHGVWSFCLMTADSGKIIASNNPQLSMIPASTMKILTTGAALGLLGENYRYETKIEYDGIYDSINGIIKGNVFIHGSGDPSLGSKHFRNTKSPSEFENIPKRLKEKGIKTIEGNIIGDASCFSENPIPDGWTWSDIGQYYGAGSCGLSYQDNSVTIHFNSTKGDSCIIDSVVPKPDEVTYRSFVTADGKKDEAFVYGSPLGNVYDVYGSIPPQKNDYEVDASNPDPALQCARDLKKNLSIAGISVSGNATTVRKLNLEKKTVSAKRKKLISILSPLLSEIVYFTNVKSDNTYAEQLLRTIGLVKGNEGTTEAGIIAVKNYWQSLGVNLEGLNMTDGSGLSRSNLLTTEIHANILQKISQQKWYSAFDKSLPIAGKNGSMAGLCKGTASENNLHAKTGYINRARGYAGYVKTKSGKLLCFSLLANNYTCTPTEMKKKLEKILIAMGELP